MGCDDLELWCSKEVNVESVLCPMYKASFSVWLCRFSVSFIVRLMKWTGWRPLPVFRNNSAESPSRKLASTLKTIGLAGLRYGIVLFTCYACFQLLKCFILFCSPFELSIFVVGQLSQGCG